MNPRNCGLCEPCAAGNYDACEHIGKPAAFAEHRSLYEISGCIADVNMMLIGRDELRELLSRPKDQRTAAAEQETVAYLVTGLARGEPSLCFEDERGDYGDEDHMPIFEALVRKSEYDALAAQPEARRGAVAELETVAWRKHLSGAEWKVADYVLPDSEELVRKSDANAQITALLAQLEEQRAVSARMEAELKETKLMFAVSCNDGAIREMRADVRRLDWLADKSQSIGNVQLPRACVERHPDSLRAAIDAARSALGKEQAP